MAKLFLACLPVAVLLVFRLDASARDLAAWVDPLIGTVGEGNAFPGACAPFGMIQAGPDSGTAVTPSGFKLTDEVIRGFSQDHLNGTGGSDLGDVLLLPFTGGVERISFASCYDRGSQVATPGFYSVRLTDVPVTVEATASERVAHWRFTWREGKEKGIFIDAASTLHRNHLKKYGPWIRSSEMRFAGDSRQITGSLDIRGWAQRKVFYAIVFDRPFRDVQREPRDAFEGAGDRATVQFDLRDGETLNVRVALSTVSKEGALGNLKADADRTFDEVRATTRTKWNEIFGRMTMEGTDEQKRNFYTALYHLCIQPNDIADADGRYRGADDAVKTSPGGHYYSTLSLWDTFRAAHPLYTILVPERVDGFVRTMLEHGRAHGHLPVWTLWGQETHDMIAVHSIPVMVDAYFKGFKGVDWTEALDRMVVSLTKVRKDCPQGEWNVFWENGGYYPYRPGCWDEGWTAGESCSRTLEVCYDWWCVEKLAAALGNERTRARAAERAAAWRKIFDKETGFVRPRGPAYEGADWRTPFDPRLSLQKGDVIVGDYTEGNAWQYTWHVFQEPFALAELMGGVDKAVAKLDEMFATPPIRPAVVGANNDAGGLVEKPGQIGQYWHGNEPSHHIAYLYSLFGRPDRAAEQVRRICTDCYRPTPDGLCGNDDCGQMSAWYLFSAMGFYPANPCGGEYVIGAPQVPAVQVKVEGEQRTFRVLAKGLSKENKYVKLVTLNGKPLGGCILKHADIEAGGELVFEMTSKANRP